MRDVIDLACTPHNEPCIQVGDSRYYDFGKKECRALINQLKRENPDYEDYPITFKINSNPHDYGTYHEVGLVYNDEDTEENIEYAWSFESKIPEYWDEEAKLELGEEYLAYVKENNK